MISKHNVTIDGYSQPGSAPNSATFLAANNAQNQNRAFRPTNSVSMSFTGTWITTAAPTEFVGFTPIGWRHPNRTEY
jgi:hypothetical protein